jgi:hypothetical protein
MKAYPDDTLQIGFDVCVDSAPSRAVQVVALPLLVAALCVIGFVGRVFRRTV